MSAGLYLHVPFCRARCTYCAFYTVTDRGPRQRLRLGEALVREMQEVAASGRNLGPISIPPLAGQPIDTVYLGGGTPSLLAPVTLERILGAARDLFRLSPQAEITLEANPETVSEEAARRWLRLGINRVSLGAQTFDARALRRVGRKHRPETIRQAVDRLRAAGLDNLNLDLIAGLSPSAFESDLASACALAPEHLSVYLLEVDEAEVGAPTPLAGQVARGTWLPPEEDWFAAAYERAMLYLRARGYVRYEICNFSRPGRQSLHNLKYWRGQEVLGFGPAAHTLWGSHRFAVVSDVDAYIEAVESDQLPSLHLDSGGPADRAAESIFLGLRLDDGVDLEAVASRTGFDVMGRYADVFAELIQDGLLERRRGRVYLTPRGVLLSNEAFQRFVA